MTARRLAVPLLVLGLLAAACATDDGGESATTVTETSTTTSTTAPPTTTEAPTTTTTTTEPPTTTTTAPPSPDLTLTVSGFPTLSGGSHYEGWAIIDDAAVSTGKFNVVDDGLVDLEGNSIAGFFTDEDLVAATTIVITIEPAGDTDDLPAETHFVAGDLGDASAQLTIDHPAAIGTDFSTANGKFVLATPTDGNRDTDELSGIWFLTLPGPEPSLDLPELPAGWNYEGWVVIDGTPVTSGTFRSVRGQDDAAPYSGDVRTPDFPGEDYLFNAPDGLTFPTNLQGQTAVVSVEPAPDDDPAPFALKPLVGVIPDDAKIEPATHDLELNPEPLPTAVATLG